MNYFLTIIIFSIFCFSCSYRISLPDKERYTLADTVVFAVKDTKQKIDSVYITSQGHLIRGEYSAGRYCVSTGQLYPGTNQLALNVVFNSGKTVKRKHDVFIVSDIVPKEFFLQEVGQLPHDTSAYTQGFLFYNDLLYESTGIKGKSRLRSINPYDGFCIKDKVTDINLFNEGISIIKDTLYKLTWNDSIMVLYDLDFNETDRINLPIVGWGLCSKNDILYVSNGTNKIIKMNSRTMDFIDTLRVIDNNGPVNYINEMECVEGKIWVNIYGKDKIVVIDPISGKVLATFSVDKLIDRKYYKDAGVMNGIAYDPIWKKVFLTGKNWPFIKVCIPDFGE